MAGAFGLAGFYFGRKPTAATSEASVSMAEGTMPWQTEGDGKAGDDFKYQYHPRGDKSLAPKNAPSALNVVIVPNVTLPKVSPSSQIGKMMLLIVSRRIYTTNSTSGARMAIEADRAKDVLTQTKVEAQAMWFESRACV